MKNHIQTGNVITVTLPRAVASGEGVKVGSLFGIASDDGPAGDSAELAMTGVYSIAKAAVAMVAGDKAYWADTPTFKITNVAAGNTLVGVVTQSAAALATTVAVRLTGQV